MTPARQPSSWPIDVAGYSRPIGGSDERGTLKRRMKRSRACPPSERLRACGAIRSRACGARRSVGHSLASQVSMATRLFAFKSTAKPSGFPYLTGREQVNMLLYQPRFRHPEKAAKPPNSADAEGIEPGLNPIFCRSRRPCSRYGNSVRRGSVG
jgi:hypothetical protein